MNFLLQNSDLKKIGKTTRPFSYESANCSVVSDSLRPRCLYSPWKSPGQTTGVGNCSLLQGIFTTQGSNPGLLHCRQILYQLSHQGSPRILEWVAYPFSSRSSRPRNWTGVTCVAGRWFTSCVNQIPYDDTVEVTNTSKGLDLMQCPKNSGWMFIILYRRCWSKQSPREKKCKKAKWLSEEVLQIAEKRREVKGKGEKERYTHLNAEFQRTTRRDKKAFLSKQWEKD